MNNLRHMKTFCSLLQRKYPQDIFGIEWKQLDIPFPHKNISFISYKPQKM